MALPLPERLAIVETQVAQILATAAKKEEQQAAILETLTAIEKEINGYKGFLGGMAFLLSCVGIFVYKFVGPIYNFLSNWKAG